MLLSGNMSVFKIARVQSKTLLIYLFGALFREDINLKKGGKQLNTKIWKRTLAGLLAGILFLQEFHFQLPQMNRRYR